MPVDPHEEIQRILNQYELEEDYKLNPPSQAYVGSLWYEPTSGQTYLCHGRINGELKWKKVGGPGEAWI